VAFSKLALALILGVFCNLAYLGGTIVAFVIWTTAEGFGGPYVAGSTAGLARNWAAMRLWRLEKSDKAARGLVFTRTTAVFRCLWGLECRDQTPRSGP